MPTQKAAVQPAPDQGRQEKNQAKELENLQRVFEWLDKKGDKKIDASELMDHLRFLGCAPARASRVAARERARALSPCLTHSVRAVTNSAPAAAGTSAPRRTLRT